MKRFDGGGFSCKNLRSWEARNGIGYQYDLCFEGMKIAFVHEEGVGGEIEVKYLDPTIEDRLTQYVKTLPPVDLVGQQLACSVGVFLGQIADNYETEQKLKRTCKTKTLVVIDDQKGYSIFKVKFSPEIKEALVAKFGSNIDIINEWFL